MSKFSSKEKEAKQSLLNLYDTDNVKKTLKRFKHDRTLGTLGEWKTSGEVLEVSIKNLNN